MHPVHADSRLGKGFTKKQRKSGWSPSSRVPSQVLSAPPSRWWLARHVACTSWRRVHALWLPRSSAPREFGPPCPLRLRPRVQQQSRRSVLMLSGTSTGGLGEGMGVGWPDSARCPPKCCATASGPLTWWGWTAHCPGVTEGEPRPALRGGSLWSWGVLDSVNVVSLLRCSGAPCPGLPPAPPNPAKSPAPSKLPSLFLALPLSYCHLCSSVKWSQESVQVDVSSGMSFHKQDTPMTPAQVE